MTKVDANFRITGGSVRLGLTILAISYKMIQTERLKNNHAPSNSMRTAWPSIFTEFSDLVEGVPSPSRIYYSPEQMRRAMEICDIYSKLPYTRFEKKLTLTKARTHKSWRELSTIYKLPWENCRRICDTVILHLVQAASLDKYKEIERQAIRRQSSSAQI